MNRHAVWLVLVPFGLAGACALDESGLLDAGADVNVPEACATLDAACLGSLGSEWSPVTIGDGGCGTGFSSVTLATNPRLLDGGCACGACTTSGAFTCPPSPISGGNQCNDSPLVNAPTGTCTQANAQHLKAHSVQATGSVACSAPNDAGAGATSDGLTVCIPGCNVDFCGGASRCVMADGNVTCPSGFQLAAHAGTGVDPHCAPCACEAGAPGYCGGTVTGFETDDCTDGGLVRCFRAGESAGL